MKAVKRCLLIGNSRWHWAEHDLGNWQFTHTNPDPLMLHLTDKPLVAWAAVGPKPLKPQLNPDLQIDLNDVPINNMPQWLGIAGLGPPVLYAVAQVMAYHKVLLRLIWYPDLM